MFSDKMRKCPLSEIKTTQKEIFNFSVHTTPTCSLGKLRIPRLEHLWMIKRKRENTQTIGNDNKNG